MLAVAICMAQPLDGQVAGGVVVATTDEATGARDRRIIVSSTDSRPPRPGADPDEYHGSALILACGNRFPSDSGRTLLLYAGEPLEPFGNEEAYAEIRLPAQKAIKRYLPILDQGWFQQLNTGARSNRYFAFLGGRDSPYYDPALLAQFLTVDTIALRFRTFGQERRADFAVGALRQAADSLSDCRWP